MAANNTTIPQYQSHLSHQDVTFAVVYSYIVIIGVPANCIIITIVRKTPSMHTTTNYLLTNLAIADLITLMFCPGMYDFSQNKMSLPKPLADVICKLFVGNAVVPITINAGALTVCAIAVERYLALVHPSRVELLLTKRRVPFVVSFLWVVAVLSSIPDVITNTTDLSPVSTYPCKRPWSLDEYFNNKGFIVYTAVCLEIIPCMVVSFCYVQTFRALFVQNTISASSADDAIGQADTDLRLKKKLLKLLFWITALFCICTLPFSLFFIYLTAIDKITVAENRQQLFFVHRMVRFLLFTNSFFNPLVYAFQSSNYRMEFKRICCCNSVPEQIE